MASNVSTSARQYLAALRALLVLTAVLGLLYPLALTAVGQLAFGSKADGSLVSRDGATIGSSLIGQNFTDEQGGALPQWFQSRPSAAGDGYDPTSTSASNLGPESEDLVTNIEGRREAAAELDGVPAGDVPPDALTASGSGLDPHISPAYAYQQVDRVATARGLDTAKVRALVAGHVQGRVLGFLGEERVNVLQLNRSLDTLAQ
jgi:K+-transporting ATPase ATPase C chain